MEEYRAWREVERKGAEGKGEASRRILEYIGPLPRDEKGWVMGLARVRSRVVKTISRERLLELGVRAEVVDMATEERVSEPYVEIARE